MRDIVLLPARVLTFSSGIQSLIQPDTRAISNTAPTGDLSGWALLFTEPKLLPVRYANYRGRWRLYRLRESLSLIAFGSADTVGMRPRFASSDKSSRRVRVRKLQRHAGSQILHWTSL